MDLVTTFETELATALLSISGQAIPSGYQYYNDVQAVNIIDEASSSDNNNYPMINIKMVNPDELIEQDSNSAYINTARYRLEGLVALENMEHPKPRYDIREKMNTLLSDIKACLWDNHTLNCSCDMVTLLSSSRVFNPNNNNSRVGQLEVEISITYSQRRDQPDKSCFNN